MFLNAFKNLFTPKATKTALKKGIRRRPELLGLEDRITPAVPFSPAFPHALSINAPGSSVTNSASFTVTFNQPVIGVDAADFQLVNTGTVANGTISSVTGSGAIYTVNVTGITGSGTLGVNLVGQPSITALPSFAAQTPFSTGTNPISVSLGDVNGDGNLDMVTANRNDNTISVLLGSGNGTFGPKTDFATGTEPFSVTLGDVNGDGRLDIVTANITSNTASVLLNTTVSGTTIPSFSTQSPFSTGTKPYSVTLGDVNGDGKLDIIAANRVDNTTSVLLGSGNGTFGPKTDFATGNQPLSVTLGDVNGDGKLDIITANHSANTTSVLLGSGNGTFGPNTDFATGAVPKYVTLGDVNGDGKLDIITANQNANTTSVLLGSGNGSFGNNTDFATGTNPVSVTLGDVNGDGRLDIVTVNFTSNDSSVLLGNGNGTFQTQQNFATGTGPSSVTLGDVNGDGRLDIVTAIYTSNNASVLLGTGGSASTATFSPQQAFDTGNNTSPDSVTLGDVNGDGWLDIVTANYNSDKASVLLGSGNGTFGPKTDFATGPGPSSVTLGDVNGDGKLDIVTANADQNANTTSVLLGSGNGTFGPKTDFATGTRPSSVTLGDVNGDGKLDIITANPLANTTSVLLGSGNGTFGPKTDFATGTNPVSVTLGDVNGDGRLDIVTANNNPAATGTQTASVLLGSGNGTFGPKTDFATGTNQRDVTLGDVNGDGKLDIIIPNASFSSDGKYVGVFLGNGNGTFQGQQTFATGNDTSYVTLGDVNADGKLDIVASNISSRNVSVLLGSGNGTFGPKTDFAADFDPRDVTLGDVNGDGRLDIVTVNLVTDKISVLLNSLAFTGQTVNVSNVAAPSVTSNPANRASNATTLTISGTGFSTTPANNSVAFNSGTGTVTAASSTQLTVTFGTAPSVGTLTAVVTSNGSSSGSAVQAASIIAPASLTQSTVNLSATATTLIITGTGFDPVAANNTVTLSSGTGTVTNATSNQLTVTLSNPPSLGNLTAVVTSYGGSSGPPVQVATVVAPPAPVISNVLPSIGPFSGNTTISITGTDFTGVNSVTIGGVAALSFTLVNATNITAVVPSGVPGAASIVVSTPYGTSSSNSQFTYLNYGILGGTSVGTSPCSVALTPDGNYAYVANKTGNSVSVIDTSNNTVVGTIASFNGPSWVAITPDGNHAYVSNYNNNTVSVISTATNTVNANISGLNGPSSICISSGGNYAYVANKIGNSVSVIDTATNTIVSTITGLNGPQGISINPDGTRVYVTNNIGNSVSVINTATNTILSTITGLNGPQGISINPDGTKVYVANNIGNSVSVIDTATNTVVSTITGLNGPQGVSVSPDGTKVYVANNIGNSVSVINTTNNLVFTNIPGVSAPIGLTVSPNSIYTYVAASGTNQLVVMGPLYLVPAITSISPNSGPTVGGTSVVITGTDLTTATSVNFGGTLATSFVVNSPTSITAITPPHTAGAVSVQVTTSGGTNSANTLFTYVAAPTPTPTPTPPSPTPTPTPSPTAPLITGTPPPPSSNGASTVNLYDAATGQPTGTAVPFPGFEGPVKVASGDFNNDGVADLVAGAGFGGGPAIAILDSQTGQVMESFFAFDPAFTGGIFVAVQDTNGDGILDIIASAGPGGGPEVRIFNGANLNLLRSFYAYAADFTGGVSVASVDFNNDGILDLVTGAGPGGAPHVKVFDGATNAIISQWYAYPVTFTGGVFVAIGDIGNDGTFEVVTGAGAGGAPVVAVWDPYTGALLSQFMAYAEDFTGGVRVGVSDGNFDGILDLLTGAGPGGGPHVKAFSFPALDLLFEFYSGEQTNPGGVFVS